MAAELRSSVDTNLLVYAHDASDTAKHETARAMLARLWETRTGVLSTQVLQEFYVVATRRLPRPLSRAAAREVVGLYATWPTVLIEPAIILGATRLEEDYALSFWDALLVEAARVAGAERLLTEDLQHDQVIEGVRIVNPFRVQDPA